MEASEDRLTMVGLEPASAPNRYTSQVKAVAVDSAPASTMRMMWPLMLPAEPATPALLSMYERGLAASTMVWVPVGSSLRLLLLVRV